MNTKLIMTVSAIFLAIMGIGLSFAPAEIANAINLGSSKNSQLMLQILGAMYFAFAMLNWTAKGSIIGGIYNKPIVVANLSHFVIGALSLIKVLTRNLEQPYTTWIFAGVYTSFAVCFSVIFFRHPAKEATN